MANTIPLQDLDIGAGVDFQLPDLSTPAPATAQRPPQAGRTADAVVAQTRPSSADLVRFAQEEATRQGVDPAVIGRMISMESGGRADAVSPRGAFGPMQLMPATAADLARRHGGDPGNPYDNIRLGVRYLRENLDEFGGDYRKAVAAYQAGPGAVRRHGGPVPYGDGITSNQDYTNRIAGGSPGLDTVRRGASAADSGAGAGFRRVESGPLAYSTRRSGQQPGAYLPVDDLDLTEAMRQPEPPAEQRGQLDYLWDSAKMGWNSLVKGFRGNELATWGEMLAGFDAKYTPEQVEADPALQQRRTELVNGIEAKRAQIGELDAQSGALMQRARPGTREFFGIDQRDDLSTWQKIGEVGRIVAQNPGVVADLVVQSGPASIAMLSTALLTRFGFGGGMTPALVSAGNTSAMVEFGNDYAELRQKGAEHEDAFRDASIKSGIIGIFDAASLNAASTALRNVMGRSGVLARAGQAAGEVGRQAAYGMAGEAGGSLASGRTPEVAAVAAEGIGEIGSGIFEAGAFRARPPAQQRPGVAEPPPTDAQAPESPAPAGGDPGQPQRPSTAVQPDQEFDVLPAERFQIRPPQPRNRTIDASELVDALPRAPEDVQAGWNRIAGPTAPDANPIEQIARLMYDRGAVSTLPEYQEFVAQAQAVAEQGGGIGQLRALAEQQIQRAEQTAPEITAILRDSRALRQQLFAPPPQLPAPVAQNLGQRFDAPVAESQAPALEAGDGGVAPTQAIAAPDRRAEARGPDRRQDAARRQRVADMTPDELRRELLTNDLTGIPNRRAYEEADRLPVQASIDADALKFVNDNMGHESGDKLLRAIAQSLTDEGIEAYHVSGDEFLAQSVDEPSLRDALARARERLAGAVITVQMPDGEIREIKGPGFSFGIGPDQQVAETRLQENKAERERAGDRSARGQQPRGFSAQPAQRGEDSGRQVAAQAQQGLAAAEQEPASAKQGLAAAKQEPASAKQRPLRKTAFDDPRLANPEIQGELRTMAREAGWAEIGGRVIRDEKGNVSGRTKWVPQAPWYGTMGDRLNRADTQAAVDKAIAGQPLSTKEKRALTNMLAIAEEHIANGRQAIDETPAAQPEPMEQFSTKDLEQSGYNELSDAGQALVDEAFDEQLDAAIDAAWNAAPNEKALSDEELDSIFGPAPEAQAMGRETAQPPAEAARGRDESRAPPARNEADEGFALSTQTPDELRAIDARARMAEEEQRKARERMAAPSADDFVLTGSSSTADEARARGQLELTEQPSLGLSAQAPTAETKAAETRDAKPETPARRPFKEEIAAIRAARDARRQAIRDAVVDGSVRLTSERLGPGLISPEPGREGRYRITRFDGDTPTGHTEYNSLEAAIDDASVQYEPDARAEDGGKGASQTIEDATLAASKKIVADLVDEFELKIGADGRSYYRTADDGSFVSIRPTTSGVVVAHNSRWKDSRGASNSVGSSDIYPDAAGARSSLVERLNWLEEKHGARRSIDAAAHDAATSPANDRPEPTEAQKEAGNYAKGHIRIAGLDISIENPAGTRRRPEWPVLPAHYGYVRSIRVKSQGPADASNNPAADAHLFGDSAEAQSIRSKGFDSLRVDRQKVVHGRMVSAFHDREILGAVIKSVPIDVVHGLVPSKPTTEQLLRDPSVFLNGFSGSLDNSVGAAAVARFIDTVATSHPPPLARLGAEKQAALGMSGTPPANGKNVAAGVTGNGSSHSAYYAPIAADGDHIDVFVNPGTAQDWNGQAFVIDQETKVGKFDEHKVMLGFASQTEAMRVYKSAYTPGAANYRGVTPMGIETFKRWLDAADLTKRAASWKTEDEFTAMPNNSFSVTRIVDWSKVVSTFAKGEHVRVFLSNSEQPHGVIKGISRAKKEARIVYDDAINGDGVWVEFDRIYKENEAKPQKKEQPKEPLTKALTKANEKAEPPGGFNAADAVSGHLERFKAFTSDLYDGNVTVEQFRSAYEAARDNESSIRADLNAMTKDELQRTFGLIFPGKKDEYVNAAYSSILRQFALNREYGPRSYFLSRGAEAQYQKDKAAALDELVKNTSAEDIAAYAQQIKANREERAAKRAEYAKAVENPETLQDFRRFIDYHTREGKTIQQARMLLSDEQRRQFDLMMAEESRANRKYTAEKRAEVRAAGQTVSGEIIETKHTQKGHDLFVVQLAERVGTDDYKTLVAGAKKLDGYYSSFRGRGAVPGFQFRTRANAEAFRSLAMGDTTAAQAAASEQRDAFEDDRSQTAAQRLRTMADRLNEIAIESLSRDRKQNTDRRARMAASAEAEARHQQALAQTMHNIAGAIEAGTAKFLDRVRQKVQVVMLGQIVTRGKNERLREQYQSYAEFEKHKDRAPEPADVEFVKFPTFTAYRSDLAKLGRQLSEIDGLKLVGQKVMKLADDVTEAFKKFAKEPANYFKLSTFSTQTGKRPAFGTADAAEAAIRRSGYRGKAIPFQIKRGEYTIIMSPSEAMERGVWQGDADTRITLDPDLGAEIVSKLTGSLYRKRVDVPYQFENAHADRQALARMGIETPAELRSALREFIGLREQPKAADRIKTMERAMIGRRADGLDFFPTSSAVVDSMIEAAGIAQGMRVLEPSAGMGHIADRLRETGIEPDVVELSGDRRELLEAKGYPVVGTDFMQMTEAVRGFTYGDLMRAPDGKTGILRGLGGAGSDRVRLVDRENQEKVLGYYDFGQLEGVEKLGSNSGYDRILMNPPFSDGRDIQHVRHAYDLLKPGGRIVAIMGESAFTNQNKRAQEFRDWLDQVGGSQEKLPPGSFEDPSLPVNTSVNARMVVIDKPDGAQFSRGAGAGMGVDAARSAAGRITSGWANGPKVEIVATPGDLPFSAPGDAKGAFWRGKVYLVASNLSDEADLQFALFHEAIGHNGLRGSLGESLDAALTEIADRNPGIREAAAKWRRENPQGNLSEKGYRLLSIEEALAGMAGRGTKPTLFRQFLAAMQRALRRIGLHQVADWIEAHSDAEALELIADARRFVTGGKAHTYTPSMAAKWSRSDEPSTQGMPLFARRPQYWSSPADSRFDSIVYELQNKQVDLRRVTDAVRRFGGNIQDAWDAYLNEELYYGRAAKRVQDFAQAELRPLLRDMQDRGVSLDDFETYLHNRHAEERNDQIARINPQMPDGGSGIDTAAARAYLAALTPEQRRNFAALAARVDAINAGTRQTLVAYGLQSQSDIDAWTNTYSKYVPLFREDLDGDGGGTGAGFSVRGEASRRAVGSRRGVVDILANVAMQRERAIVRGEKNRVATALYGLARLNPNPDFWDVDRPRRVSYVDERTGLVATRLDQRYQGDQYVLARIPDGNGNIIERAVVFNERNERAMRSARALKNLDRDQLGFVLGNLAKVTRYFASINTQYNPIFGIVNLTRDFQGAMFNLSTTPIAGRKAQVTAHAARALIEIYRDLRSRRASGQTTNSPYAQLWEEFQNEGGQTGYMDAMHLSDERAQALASELRQLSEGRVKAGARAVFQWLSDYNTTMENAVRLGAYKTAIDAGISRPQAASLAKNLTVNFNRKGQMATQAGALYAFFNASVQGTARLAETLRGPAGRQIIAGGLILGVVQAMALAAAGFDDNEPPDFVRERNVSIPLGGSKYITIPMPLGFHIIPNISRIATEYALGGFRNGGKKLSQLIGSFAEAFNPIGNAGLSMQTLAPTAIDPIAALAENKDWTGKPIAKQDRSSLDPTPGFTRAKDTATWLAKRIAEGLNTISGGTQYTPGALSPTPDQIDYLVGQVTGGVGREISKAAQGASALISGEELPPHKRILVGRFYGDTASQSSAGGSFYENLRELNILENEIKGRAKDGKPIEPVLKAHPEAELIGMANGAERQLTHLNRAKQAAVAAGDKAQVKMVEQEITSVMRRLNEAVKAARSQAAKPAEQSAPPARSQADPTVRAMY